jgi:hypothetical protein
MRITRRLAVHRTRPVMRVNEGNGHHHTVGVGDDGRHGYLGEIVNQRAHPHRRLRWRQTFR